MMENAVAQYVARHDVADVDIGLGLVHLTIGIGRVVTPSV